MNKWMRILVLLVSVLAFRLDVSGQAGVRKTMDESTDKQKLSVRKQLLGGGGQENTWFTLPWIKAEPIKSISDTPLSGAAEISYLDTCKPIDSTSVDSLVARAASKEGVSTDLLKAVVKQESRGDPCAVSAKGAMGLMQLMPGTATDLGVVNPFDPAENLMAGAKMLGQLLQKYAGDVSLALGAYNSGPKTVDSYGGLPPYPETQTYVDRIMGSLTPARAISW
jgi:hypothetical protein